MKTQINSETQKAAYELAGMIYGVSLDGIVNRNEYEALKNWCFQNEVLCQHETFQRLYTQIQPIILDGKVNHEELAEITAILKDFLGEFETEESKHPNLYFLNGIFEGILASGDVNTYEVYRLNQWIEKHGHLRSSAPFDELIPLVESVLEDQRVDDHEALTLKKFFSTHLIHS